MRVAVTGGGTGGHVFPALEIARLALEGGHEVRYLGSRRGQEGPACALAGIPFEGFPSEPLVSLRSIRGWRAAVRLLRARAQAARSLRTWKPDALFSTGGYASAPVVSAAANARIPYVIHEQNSVPGRTNLLLAKKASAIATTFEASAAYFPSGRVVRTGLPVRQELRALAAREPEGSRVLVVGGSQGAKVLNDVLLQLVPRLAPEREWLHVSGQAGFEELAAAARSPNHRIVPFLQAAEMAQAYAEASFVIGRSGAGTLSELAAFRLPSVLVPYPLAHAQHQLYNAREFEDMEAAVVVEQRDLSPEILERAVRHWEDPQRCLTAQTHLAVWDVPDAGKRILKLVTEAAER